MYNRGSSPTLTNVTFSGNSGLKGGGLVNTLRGSAASEMSDPTLNNVTLSCNSAITYGGGMWNFYSNPVLSNVILWGDTAGSEGPEIYNYKLESYTLTITDSVVEGGCPADQYSACTNVITDDPKLGPLAANGGFTQTHALLPGSSAIDAGGVNSSCEATDQRGVSRPQGAACDIGAYEFLLPLFADGFECGSCSEWSNTVGEVP
jgi:hypothetical protein